jgi:histone-lysine N-methyltransferase ASH1L
MQLIYCNFIITAKRQQADSLLCECTDGPGKCAEDCLNRFMFIECPVECGIYCMNRKIQKHEWAPGIQRFLTQEKGLGVKTTEMIKEGDFVLEYDGEIVSDTVYRERTRTEYTTENRYYGMGLESGLVVDAHRSGGEGRFVNHSCDPNCVTQKWSVDGRCRVALFALRDILPDEELTFDYKFSLFDPAGGQVTQISMD